MPHVTVPITLPAYPSSSDGVWIFPWGLVFDKAIHDPATLRFQLQIDTFPTFASPNLIDVSSNSANIVSFQNGPIGKAIEVLLPKRTTPVTTWYWRMRINGYGYAGGYVSDWSQTNSLAVPSNQSLTKADDLFALIADSNVYMKTAKSSNVYKLFAMLGREFDDLTQETNNTQSDLSLENSRDTALQNNFGDLVELAKITTEPNVAYRWKVRELFKAFINTPGVVTGILRSVEAFVCEPPTILDSSNTAGWILPVNYIKAPTAPQLQPIIVLYSTIHKGFNWTLQIWNSWNLSYDQTVLESYVNRIKPAHTRTTFSYPTQRHAQIRLNTAADWNACVLSNLGTDSSGALTITSGTSGTATTPVFLIENASAWDTLELEHITAGQTVVVELRTSPDNSTFSTYETLLLGQSPTTSPLNKYIQLRVSLSTTTAANKPIVSALRLNLQHT